MQSQPARARRPRQACNPRRRRHARRVQHDRCLGRRLDGDRGDAGVARVPRGDRGLDRARRPRPPARRPGLRRRLRQDEPGGRNGPVPARPAWPGALLRDDRAGHLPRARGDDPGGLRGDRRPCRRAPERRGPARARVGRVSGRRRVRRPVHGEHDVGCARVPRHLACRPERHPGARRGEGGQCPRGRQARDGARARRRPAVAGDHARVARERRRRRGRDRRLDERHPPPAGDRTRARPRVHACATSTRSRGGRRS